MKLRWLLLIAFVGVTLIPVAFLGIWPRSKALQIEEERVSDQHLLLARHLKHALERYHRDAVSVFNLLVSNVLDGNTLEGANGLMDNLNFRHICVANFADGRMIHSLGPKALPCPPAIPKKRLMVFKSVAKEGETTLTGILQSIWCSSAETSLQWGRYAQIISANWANQSPSENAGTPPSLTSKAM
jgi:hypothetical protein